MIPRRVAPGVRRGRVYGAILTWELGMDGAVIAAPGLRLLKVSLAWARAHGHGTWYKYAYG